MITLEFDEAVSLLNRAVEEKGEDYVYVGLTGRVGEQCAYFHSGNTPGCIVGHVLHYKGYTENDLNGRNTVPVRSLAVDKVLSADSRTVEFLQRVQNSQDCGDCWGDAVKYAMLVNDKEGK